MRVQVPNHHVVWKEDMTARGGFFVKIVLEDLLVPREGNHTTCGQLEDIQRSMPYLSDVGRQMEERKSNACIITEMEHQAREQLPTTETKSGLRDQPPAFHAERTGDEKQHLGRQLEQRHGWHFCFRFVRIYFKGYTTTGTMPRTSSLRSLPTALQVALQVTDKRWGSNVLDASIKCRGRRVK